MSFYREGKTIHGFGNTREGKTTHGFGNIRAGKTTHNLKWVYEFI